eukprot:1155725-Pleurochrysis_carterae.AAC.5
MAADLVWAAATGIACGAACFGGARWLKRVFQIYKTDTSHRSLRVVITGSTRGLGLALASKFITLGDHVVLCGRNVQRVNEVRQQLTSKPLQASQRVVAVAGDVARPEDCERIAQVAVKELGGIDIWINNAGTTQEQTAAVNVQVPKATLAETPADAISSVISTNLLGTIYGCRAAIQVMQKQVRGVRQGSRLLLVCCLRATVPNTANCTSLPVNLHGICIMQRRYCGRNSQFAHSHLLKHTCCLPASTRLRLRDSAQVCCMRACCRCGRLRAQGSGHVFNMDGTGSRGNATPKRSQSS